MSLPLAILLTIAGLVLLAAGGEALVRGAVATSHHLHVTPAVIGLTIVAMCTSLPELAVSVLANLGGNPDVAVGNVVGSNIFNLAVILGVSAIFFPPLLFREAMIRFDVGVMTLSAGLAAVVMHDRVVSRPEGVVLLGLIVAFLVYRSHRARQAGVEPGQAEEIETHARRIKGVASALGLIVGGAAVLTAGAEVLVRGAVGLAVLAGVSERVIGLTLVSAGTGLPELATAIVAGVRKHAGVAVGNVIGSNIFNVFGILGTVAVVRPAPVAPAIAERDVWWMLAFCAVAIVPVARSGRRISRPEGIVIVVAYALYIASLL